MSRYGSDSTEAVGPPDPARPVVDGRDRSPDELRAEAAELASPAQTQVDALRAELGDRNRPGLAQS